MLGELITLLQSGMIQLIILLIMPGYIILYTIVNSRKSQIWYFFPEWEKFDKLDRLIFSFVFSLLSLLISLVFFLIGYLLNIYSIEKEYFILHLMLLHFTLPIYYFINCFWINNYILKKSIELKNKLESIQLLITIYAVFPFLINFSNNKFVSILSDLFNKFVNFIFLLILLFIEFIKRVPIVQFVISLIILLLISTSILTFINSESIIKELLELLSNIIY